MLPINLSGRYQPETDPVFIRQNNNNFTNIPKNSKFTNLISVYLIIIFNFNIKNLITLLLKVFALNNGTNYHLFCNKNGFIFLKKTSYFIIINIKKISITPTEKKVYRLLYLINKAFKIIVFKNIIYNP